MNRIRITEEDLLDQYRTPRDLSKLVIDLEVTSVCDAVCGFCPREFMPDKKRFISLDLIRRLADELRSNPTVLVILCGIGESTLHPQLDKIVRTLADAGANVQMTTNGGRMNPQRFRELVEQGMTGFNFSLNALTAETHRRVMRMKNFEQIVRNVQLILDLRDTLYPDVLVHVSFVINNLNEHEVFDFVEFWRPTSVRQIWLHPLNNRAGLLSPEVRKCSDLEKFVLKYDGDPRVLVDVFSPIDEPENVCKIAHHLVFLSADGEMRLCALDYRRTISFGNLAQKTVLEMQRDKLGRYLRGDVDALCKECDFCPDGLRVDQQSSPAIARNDILPQPAAVSFETIRQFDLAHLSPENQQDELRQLEKRLHDWSVSAGRQANTAGPIVSVETPVFKGAFLIPCLESVLCQTWHGWVLSLLWDEGDDLSRQILERVEALGHPKLKVHYGKNRGIARARHFLSENSGGDYILSLDDDDMLAPTSLEKLVAIAEARPWSAIVRAQREFIDEFGNWVNEAPWFPFEPRQYEFGMVKDLHNHCQPSLMRRSLYEKTSGWEGFQDFMFAGEDCDVYLKLEELGSIELLEEVLYYYRLHGKRASHRLTAAGAYEMWRRLADKTIKRIGLPLRRVSDEPPFSYEALPRETTTHEMVDILVSTPAVSRNEAFEGCTRPVICYVDAPGTPPEWLDRLLEVMNIENADVIGPNIFEENGALRDTVATTPLLFRREVFRAVGGFDDQNLPKELADIDFCLKANQRQFNCRYVDVPEGASQSINLAGDGDRLYRKWPVLRKVTKAAVKQEEIPAIVPRYSDEYEQYFQSGNKLVEEGRLQEAVAAYEKAVDLHNTFFWSYFNMGNALYQLERWTDAASAFRIACHLDSTVSWAHNNLGNAFTKLERWEDAAVAYRRAIEIKPDLCSAYENLGHALFRVGLLREAADAYTKAVEIQPDSFGLLYQLGDTWMALERWGDAVSAFERAIQIAPDSFWAHNNLGNALMRMQRWNDAAVAFKRAIEIADVPATHRQLGQALVHLERWDEADVAYRHALRVDFSDLYPYQTFANLLVKLERWDQAARLYEELAELQPHAYRVQHGLGDVLFNAGRMEEALRAYQRAVELNPEFYISYENMGNALCSLERWTDAVEAYRRAIELNPYLFDSRHHLGSALWRSGNVEEAVAAYKSAIEVNPKISVAHHDLADQLITLGRWEEAAFEYRLANELNPAWTKYSPSETAARIEQWIETKSKPKANHTARARGGAERLMFILDTDYGELTTIMYFLLGQDLLSRTTLLLPPRLYVNNNDSLPGRTFLYSSYEDIMKAVDAEKPAVVLLCSGYLFSIHHILSLDTLRHFVNLLDERGCCLVTSDPFLWTLSKASPETISIDIAENSPPRLQRIKEEVDRRLVENFKGSFEILKNVPHLYPAFPVNAEQLAAREGLRSLSFFNDELVFPAEELKPGKPVWFFILASRDYELQINFHGRIWVLDSLIKKFEQTVRADRQAVFIGPYDCIQGLIQRMTPMEGVSLLSYCPFKRFASLLLNSEYAFYWNVVSHTMLLRLFNELPVFMFDRGHLVRNVKPLYQRVVEWYYQGYEPMYLDQEGELDPDVLRRMTEAYRQTARGICNGMRRAPSPEKMMDEIRNVPLVRRKSIV